MSFSHTRILRDSTHTSFAASFFLNVATVMIELSSSWPWALKSDSQNLVSWLCAHLSCSFSSVAPG